jgi:hypothetical protein
MLHLPITTQALDSIKLTQLEITSQCSLPCFMTHAIRLSISKLASSLETHHTALPGKIAILLGEAKNYALHLTVTF